MDDPIALTELYALLLEAYGKQGWWPVLSRRNEPGFDNRGYHSGKSRTALDEKDQWEIAIGAILTQNTAWANVEKALQSLSDSSLETPRAILAAPPETIARAIRSSGYYNQKALRLRRFAEFYQALQERVPARAELLALSGIGPETADSMLLYAWQQPFFVVDAYTIRIFRRLGFIDESFFITQPSKRYEHVQLFITSRLIFRQKVAKYQEIHALLVRHAKEHCAAKAQCESCPLEARCRKML
jgi:endonuclease-3 related protein